MSRHKGFSLSELARVIPQRRPVVFHQVETTAFLRALLFTGGCLTESVTGEVTVTFSTRTKVLVDQPARQTFSRWSDVPATLVQSVMAAFEQAQAEAEALLRRCRECELRQVPNPPAATEPLLGIVCLCKGCAAAWDIPLTVTPAPAPLGRDCSYCYEPVVMDTSVKDQLAEAGSFQGLCGPCWRAKSRRTMREFV